MWIWLHYHITPGNHASAYPMSEHICILDFEYARWPIFERANAYLCKNLALANILKRRGRSPIAVLFNYLKKKNILDQIWCTRTCVQYMANIFKITELPHYEEKPHINAQGDVCWGEIEIEI